MMNQLQCAFRTSLCCYHCTYIVIERWGA